MVVLKKGYQPQPVGFSAHKDAWFSVDVHPQLGRTASMVKRSDLHNGEKTDFLKSW